MERTTLVFFEYLLSIFCQAKLTLCLPFLIRIPSHTVVDLMHICRWANEPLRPTQMGLPPAENMLDGAGSGSIGSIEKEMSGSSVSRSHDDVLAVLPPLSEWEQWPVMFRFSPSESSNVRRLDCTDPFSPIRINCNDVSVPFETSLFCGRVIIRMAGLPGAEDYFRGRKRLTDFVVQGQFRRTVRFDRLMTGQRFRNRLKTVNGRFARVVVGFIKTLQPSVEIDLLADSPFWVSTTFFSVCLFLIFFFFLHASLSLLLLCLHISPNCQCPN